MHGPACLRFWVITLPRFSICFASFHKSTTKSKKNEIEFLYVIRNITFDEALLEVGHVSSYCFLFIHAPIIMTPHVHAKQFTFMLEAIKFHLIA